MDWTSVQQAVITWGRPVFYAAIILIAAHFVAKAAKWAIAKGIDRLPFISRRDSAGPGGAKPMIDVGDRIGEVGYWLVWLLGLIAALNQFGDLADPVVDPLQGMVNSFASALPNIVGAALVFLIGFALATVVRRMVEATVEAAELDRRLIDAGLTHTPRGPGLARMLGILVFTLIIIPATIAALDVLSIDAISTPAMAMLNTILTAIPRVIGAALVIFIFYLVGRWIMTLTEEGLKSIGFDAIIASIADAEPIRAGRAQLDPTPGVDTIDLKTFPPSRMIGLAVLIGIVLFASVEAARLLEFGAMAAMLGSVLELASRVLFGLVIIALGVLLATILSNAVAKDDKASSEIMAVLVRWGVIALSAAVGLRFMGLANDIIVLAFGLMLGSVAVAVAIAFGVGGRDAAKRLLDRWSSR